MFTPSVHMPVADPGFPVGGRPPRRGAPTPEAATFQKISMSKRKNLDPWGRVPVAPPGSANVSIYILTVKEEIMKQLP